MTPFVDLVVGWTLFDAAYPLWNDDAFVTSPPHDTLGGVMNCAALD
jgi:hypothetical protein